MRNLARIPYLRIHTSSGIWPHIGASGLLTWAFPGSEPGEVFGKLDVYEHLVKELIEHTIGIFLKNSWINPILK